MVDIIGMFKEKSEITVDDVYRANPGVRPETVRKRIRDVVRVGFVAAANVKENGNIHKDTVLSLTDKTFDIRIRENKTWRKKCLVSG
jgi:hypothetical protein